MLVHTALGRAEQVARHWSAAGCPSVSMRCLVPPRSTAPFATRWPICPTVRFSKRHRCEWGTWGIVAASQSASEMMLAISAGAACLPGLRLLPAPAPGAGADRLPRGAPPHRFHRKRDHRRRPLDIGGLDASGLPCAFRFRGAGTAIFSTAMSPCNAPRDEAPHPRRDRAAYGQPMVVPDAPDPVGHPDDPERPAYDRYFPRSGSRMKATSRPSRGSIPARSKAGR